MQAQALGPTPLRINLGCGHTKLAGYEGVDIVDYGQRYIADLQRLPFSDGAADEVMAIHVIEHFYIWDIPDVLAEWHRVLAPGGKIVLEAPDLAKVIANINAGEKNLLLTLMGLYGDIREKTAWHQHKWCWTPQAMARCLSENGFKDAHEEPAQFHHPEARDFRVVARV